MADPKILSDLSIAPITVNQAAQPSFGRTGTGRGLRAASVRAARDIISQSGSGASVSALRFPLDTPKYYFSISISAFNGFNAVGGGPGAVTFNSQGAIVLPIPSPLVDTQEIEYTEYPFGPAWGTVGNAVGAGIAQGVQDIANGAPINEAAANGLNQIPGGSGGTVAGGAGLGVAQAVAPGAVNIAGAFGGFAVNQFYTVLLKGPKYKRYQFTWDLAPRNLAESESIRAIIQAIRAAAAPGLAGNGLLWDFPYIVQCTFVPQGNGVDTYMYRFKPAVMEAVSVDYAPFGKPGFYKGEGAPESVKLSIQFLELEYWLREDF